MLFWFLASLVVGLVFATAAVPLRRRLGPTGLVGAAVAVGSAAATAGIAFLVAHHHPEDVKWSIGVFSAALLGACVLGSVVVERVVRSGTVPDPLAEIAAGAAAFGIGAAAAAFLALVPIAALPH